MQIDWFTFVAQIVNFLILLALLKRLLYNRIIGAMDRREQEISDRLQQAEKTQAEAQQEKERYRERHEQLETRRNKILSQAREEAEQAKKDMLQDARDEVTAKRRQWQESLEREQHDFERQLRRQGTQQVMAVSRRVMADLADQKLEGQIAARFRHRLESLNADQWERLQRATDKGASVTVSSSFALSEQMRDGIEEVLGERLDEVSPAFEKSSRVICGISLEAGGFELAWSVDSYIEDMTQRLVDLVENRGRSNQDAEAGDTGSEQDDEDNTSESADGQKHPQGDQPEGDRQRS